MSIPSPMKLPRRQILAFTLCSLFVGFFVAAELLGSKLFEFSLFGIGPRDIGTGDNAKFTATAGILAFPLTFVMTDIVNEYFGKATVKHFTWIAIAVNLLLQPVVQAAIRVPAVSFTPGVTSDEVQHAYQIALGQSWQIVAASLVAFAVAQWLDVQVFTWLRRLTGGKLLWLRSQGSTVVSQLIDTIVVIYLAFVVIPALTGGNAWSIAQATEVSFTNYVYKFLIAVLSTPVLYFVHGITHRYLGHDEAEALVHSAHPKDPD
jgi:uncharacterized integral membrane protein (TIGR00697 family)